MVLSQKSDQEHAHGYRSLVGEVHCAPACAPPSSPTTPACFQCDVNTFVPSPSGTRWKDGGTDSHEIARVPLLARPAADAPIFMSPRASKQGHKAGEPGGRLSRQGLRHDRNAAPDIVVAL